MATSSEDAEDDISVKDILYEFITYAEWPLEPELMVKKEAFSWRRKRNSTLLSSVWSKLSFIAGSLSPDIFHLNNSRLSWKFAIGVEGKLLAVLQDNIFEIRSFKDDYSIVVGSNSVKKDFIPQWRHVQWSPDNSFLAISYSDGSVDCFDSTGTRLFTINSVESTSDLGEALVEIMFIDTRVKSGTKWMYELVLINYKGYLRSYYISYMEYELSHLFHFKQSVTAAVYHPKFNVIFICGQASGLCISGDEDEWNASLCGVSTWRLIHGMPHYKQSYTIEQEANPEIHIGYLQHITSKVFGRRTFKDRIYKIVLSPNGSLLASVHVSGTISVWNIPSMRLLKKWTLEQQPDAKKCVKEEVSFGARRKTKILESKLLPNQVFDINWWSEKAVVIGRYNGAVSVSSVNSDLNNLLGGSVEWFDSQPQLSSAFDNRFLVLECDHQLMSRRSPSTGVNSEDDIKEEKAESSSDEETDSSSSLLKSAVFYITDMERFRPHKRKSKLISKIYRLICLKSTTPEELFLSKLDDEQFGEALALAKTYALDCDMVYQRQWRNSGFSSIAIQDYLSKISKRFWILQECMERVPEDIDSARALLQFGLQGTDFNVLLSIGKGVDNGKFILDLDDSFDDVDVDDFELLQRRRSKAIQEFLSQVDFLSLTAEQKHLCRCRIKLLQYSDRLTTYEVMLGGPAYSAESFDSKFYSVFRSQPAVEAAVEFAHQSNWQGVSALFTYHGKQVLPHRLAILSNFPETTSPYVYKSLLPEAGFNESEYFVYAWEEEHVRNCDWVEAASCLDSCGLELDASAASFLYDERPNLNKYIDFEKSPDLLNAWYIERAFEIEENSRLVNFALDLLRLGMERNVRNLETLCDELVTMEVLVYECQNEELITLKTLQNLSDSEKLKLLMSNSTNEDIVKNTKLWAIPFLSRCEKKSLGSSQELLRQYMIELSCHRLDSCAILIRSAPHQQHFLTTSTSAFISLALDCIYSCEDDMLDSAISIFESIPHKGFGLISTELEAMHNKVNGLEAHINAAKILKKYNLSKSIAYIKSCQEDAKEIKGILTMLTRIACRKESTFSESDLKELLDDLLKLQSCVFSDVNILMCVEILAESLLTSGRSDYVQMSTALLQCKSSGQMRRHLSSSSTFLLPQYTISRERSISLIISASREYFNSSEMNDPIMDLAKQCLRMIEDPDENVLAELDLIESLKILHYFGIILLPLQIRLCENRLDLIRQVFQINPAAYQDSQKLLNLAHCLRVGQDVKEWEEQVFILVATAALKANDFVASYNACHRLVSQKYSKGWKVCFELGRCETFEDIDSRCDLLTFASVHCPTDMLESVLKIKLSVNSLLIKKKMQDQLDLIQGIQSNSESEMRQKINPKNIAAQIQHHTVSTTKQALSKLSGSKFLRDASSWLNPLWQAHSSSEEDEFVSFNLVFTKLSVPTFYSTCIPDALESPLMTTYRSYAMPRELPSLSVSLKLIHLVMLTWDEENGDKLTVSLQIIQQIVKNLLPIDTVFGLACLLTTSDPTVIDECFRSLPNTDTCVQLAIYVFSLRICQLAGLIGQSKLYTTDSETLFKRAERFARLNYKTVEDTTLKRYCECLQHYVKKKEDFLQGKMLLSIGRGVDVGRFCCDAQYQFETVLGLVMTTDDKIFNVAISLSDRYQMDSWELYMTHLEYLFSEEDLKLSVLEKRVTKLELIPKLLKDELKFKERMESRIYATISGVDHSRLVYYYSLLQQCSQNSIEEQLALLKKLRSLAKGLDFIKLVNGSDNIEDILKPAVTSSNIKKIAKLAPQISYISRQALTSSGIYRIFALNCFTEKREDENQELPAEFEHWITRYNVCKDFFEFFEPSDFCKFLDDALFSDSTFDDIPQGARNEILNRSHKFAKQTKQQKAGSSQADDWEEAISFVSQAKNHVMWLQSEKVVQLLEDGDDILKEFAQELKLAHSSDKLKILLLQYVVDGCSVDVLQRLLSMCPPAYSLQIKDLISEAFSIVISYLSEQNCQYSQLLAHHDVIDVLKKMIDQIIVSHIEIVPLNEILTKLESIFIMESITTPVRLKLIDLIEQFYVTNDEKLKVLRSYKMKVMITRTWPEIMVSDDILQSETGKEELFNDLLANSQTLEQGKYLMRILTSLQVPSIESSSDPLINPWCRIMRFMLSCPDVERFDYVINCLRMLPEGIALNLLGLEPIFKEISEHGSTLHTLKFGLLTKHKELHTQLFDYLKVHSNESVINIDEETCELLIERQLLPQTVSTVLFKPMVDYIIKYKEVGFVRNLAAELRNSGYAIEAATLLMKITTVSKSLQTFSSALGLMKRWL